MTSNRVPLEKKNSWTSKGVKEYYSKIENITSNYLNNMAAKDGEEIKLSFPQHGKSIIKPDKTYKNNWFNSFFFNPLYILVLLVELLLLIPFTVLLITESMRTQHPLGAVIGTILLLSAAHIGCLGCLKDFLKSLKSIVRTGHMSDVFYIIRKYKTNAVAITENSIYISFYNGEKRKIKFKKFDLRDINFAWTEQKNVVRIMNHEGKKISTFYCPNSIIYDQVIQLLKKQIA